MSVMTISGKVVRKNIKESEHEVEQWQLDHQEVEICRRLEKWLARVIWLFDFIVDFDETWRTEVFRGVARFEQEDYQVVGEVYEDWLGLEVIVSPLIDHYKAMYPVDDSDKFRHCCQQAREILESRAPPTVSKAIGLRELTLNAAESREVMELLKQPGEQAKEPIQPMKTVDASFLLMN